MEKKISYKVLLLFEVFRRNHKGIIKLCWTNTYIYINLAYFTKFHCACDLQASILIVEETPATDCGSPINSWGAKTTEDTDSKTPSSLKKGLLHFLKPPMFKGCLRFCSVCT